MDRRRFIRDAGFGLLAIGMTGCGGGLHSDTTGGKSAVQPPPQVPSKYDPAKLVVAQGTEPDMLIAKGLAALGGIGALVNKGNTVIIKPNFSVPRKPEEAATTNPQLVAALVRHCLGAGAKAVKVIDFPFASPPVCLNNSGMKAAVEAVGGKVFTIHKQSYYTTVDSGGKLLGSIEFSSDVLEADVFINFPILKHHSITKLTLGMKNLMGLVWDRGYFHRTDLHKTIAELAAFRRPHLTILDAIRGITANGPVGPGPIQEWNQVIFGADPVAVDSYGASLFGRKPTDIDYIVHAAQLGVGEMDLERRTVIKV